MHTFARVARPRARRAAMTAAGSSASTASVLVEPRSVRISQISAMQPPTV